MRTFRRRLRSLGAPCLTFLLGIMPVEGAAQPLVSEAGQIVSSRPMPADEYQKLLSEVVNSAKVETGPILRNPAISDEGLPLGIVAVLREQRSYLERHGATPQSAQTMLSANRLASERTRDPLPRQHIACHKTMIRSVNGKSKGVVFTPTVENNTYSIEGCFFGTSPGIVRLEADTASSADSVLPIAMQLDSNSVGAWSDGELRVRMESSLAGIPDQPVTLVIYPLKRPRIELRGCRFVAARGNPQLLSVIPSAWVKLYPSGVDSHSIRRLEYSSPTPALFNVDQHATAASALVTRWNGERFEIGKDNYDFSQLNPGWVVEAVQMQTYSILCPGDNRSAQSFGHWETEWTLSGLSVAFENRVCMNSIPRSFAFSISFSQYAIRVWVVGPKGTQPLPLIE